MRSVAEFGFQDGRREVIAARKLGGVDSGTEGG